MSVYDRLTHETIVAGLQVRITQLEQERDEHNALRNKMTRLLNDTANALKGEPPELTSWSWHDLPEIATAYRALYEKVRDGLSDLDAILRSLSEGA